MSFLIQSSLPPQGPENGIAMVVQALLRAYQNDATGLGPVTADPDGTLRADWLPGRQPDPNIQTAIDSANRWMHSREKSAFIDTLRRIGTPGAVSQLSQSEKNIIIVELGHFFPPPV